jgi:hypothetical protein
VFDLPCHFPGNEYEKGQANKVIHVLRPAFSHLGTFFSVLVLDAVAGSVADFSTLGGSVSTLGGFGSSIALAAIDGNRGAGTFVPVSLVRSSV